SKDFKKYLFVSNVPFVVRCDDFFVPHTASRKSLKDGMGETEWRMLTVQASYVHQIAIRRLYRGRRHLKHADIIAPGGFSAF
ncbi:hypothetical protein PISMIDRAFT_681266, partial [Pisolithus microcarpus 441]